MSRIIPQASGIANCTYSIPRISIILALCLPSVRRRAARSARRPRDRLSTRPPRHFVRRHAASRVRYHFSARSPSMTSSMVSASGSARMVTIRFMDGYCLHDLSCPCCRAIQFVRRRGAMLPRRLLQLAVGRRSPRLSGRRPGVVGPKRGGRAPIHSGVGSNLRHSSFPAIAASAYLRSSGSAFGLRRRNSSMTVAFEGCSRCPSP